MMCLKIVYIDQRAICVVVFLLLADAYRLGPGGDLKPLTLTHCLRRGILTKRQVSRRHGLRHAAERFEGIGEESRYDDEDLILTLIVIWG